MTAEDRAVGALLGLACGDAVGTTLEFARPGSFTPITDMVGGGPFRLQRGQWTDDTSMALCLAESILDTGGLDLSDQLRRYLLWRDEGYLSSTGRCFDIGNTTSIQLERFRRTGEPVDPAPDDEAAANGSLMRLAPVPIRWHADPAVAAERAGESSRTTHAAARPADACRVLGTMVGALIAGTSADEVLTPDFWRWGDLHPTVDAVARGSWRDKEPPAIRGTGYCVDALEAALWAVGGASDFRDAVLRAANLGDDADTTAAIAGQLAGARWGASGIPAAWRERVAARDRIESLARGLFRAGGGPHPHGDTTTSSMPGGSSPVRSSPGSTPATPTTCAPEPSWSSWSTPACARSSTSRPRRTGSCRTSLSSRRSPSRGAWSCDTSPSPSRTWAWSRTFATPTCSTSSPRASGPGVVYVHCWGGVGRTGTVIGSVLAGAGAGYEEILQRLDTLRAGTSKANRSCPENALQRAVLQRRCASDDDERNW